jgi:hypothetical protein
MSVIVATKEEVQEYYLSEALGQSKLKSLLGDISHFNKEFDSSAEHFLIGSAVDCLLTSTKEEYDNTYYVSEVENTPSEALVGILTIVHGRLLEDYAEHLEVVQGSSTPLPVTPFPEYAGDLITWAAYIVDACEFMGWQSRWGAEAKVKNIVENTSEYFKDLCKAFGKKVISKKQSETINSIVHSLTTHPRTAGLFDRETLQDFSTIEVYYQFPIYFEYRGVKCKALLDIVFVERSEEGEVISVTPVDLKTMNGNTYHFPNSIRQRRYDIQGAWYSLALMDHFALWNTPGKLKPFQFVVESTSFQGKPLVFIMDESLLHIGSYGKKAVSLVDTDFFSETVGQSEILKQEVLGFEQLLDLFIYHSENGFREEKEIQEAGIQPLVVNWNGIMS